MRFRSRRPVAQERGLEPGGTAAFDAEMGVAPCAPLRAADIAVGDVHAADESDAAVYHDDLAVVAVIDFAGEEREFDVQEGVYFNPGVAHPFEKGVLCTPAAYVVVEDANPDALARLCDQGIPQAATRLVVVEDVILDMDVVPCAGDLLHQRLHLRLSVGIDGDAAAVERYGVQRIEQQRGERPVAGRDAGAFGVFGLFELHGDALAGAARNDALLGEVLPEEEIEDQPDHGGQYQYDDPRQGLQRIPVFGDDDQNDAEDRDRVYNQEEVCQYLLHTGFSFGANRCRAGSIAAALPAGLPRRGILPGRAGAPRRACSCVWDFWASRCSSRA